MSAFKWLLVLMLNQIPILNVDSYDTQLKFFHKTYFSFPQQWHICSLLLFTELYMMPLLFHCLIYSKVTHLPLCYCLSLLWLRWLYWSVPGPHIHPHCFACLHRSSWLHLTHKCHCGVISSCWLAMLLLLAEAERYEGNVSWCWPLPAGKAIFMRVCKSKSIVSAASEIQCNIEQWWKNNEKWPAARQFCVLGYFMSFWGSSPTLFCAIQMQ